MTKEELVNLAGSLQSQISQMESQVSRMQFQIDQMNRLLYGAKRERFISNTDENQLSLPFEVPQEKAPEKEKETITYVREKNKQKEHPGRLALPDHLPVEEIILEPQEDTTGMKCIGKEVTDQLELVPAKLYIKRFIRPGLCKDFHNLGRKNYLFAGSTRGAERAAMMYSFFGTCKKNDVNPFEWLKKVLEVIPTHKVNRLTELLPQNLEI